MDKTTYKVKANVDINEFTEEAIIYDAEVGSIHVLNHTALTIYRFLSSPRTLDDIINIIHDTYENVKCVQNDVQEILESFLINGLLEREE